MTARPPKMKSLIDSIWAWLLARSFLLAGEETLPLQHAFLSDNGKPGESRRRKAMGLKSSRMHGQDRQATEERS